MHLIVTTTTRAENAALRTLAAHGVPMPDTLIEPAELALHLEDARLGDPRLPLRPRAPGLGRGRLRRRSHPARRCTPTSTGDLSGARGARTGRHPLPAVHDARGHFRPPRHRRARAGDRLRPGQRRLRGTPVVAAALARSPPGRGAQRRPARPGRRPDCRSARAAVGTRAARASRAQDDSGVRWRARQVAGGARRRRAAQRGATRPDRCARAPIASPGENETLDPVAGHVPGARNHPFAGNLRRDGRFLPQPRSCTQRLGAHTRRSAPATRRSPCAAPASPRATTCSRSRSRGSPARGCTRAPGASGSAIRRTPVARGP